MPPRDTHHHVLWDLAAAPPPPHRRNPIRGLSPPLPGHPHPHCGLGHKLKFNFIKPAHNQSLAPTNNARRGASCAAVIHPASPALVRKLLELHFPPKFMALAASGA